MAKCPKCNAVVTCPKCNFLVPDTGSMPVLGNQVTILVKRKLVFEVGEGETKRKFEVYEPSAKKRDEYLEMVTRISKQIADKQVGVFLLNKRIEEFSQKKHDENEWKVFNTEITKESKRVEKLPMPAGREQIEFFLGKIDDVYWDNELVPSMREQILSRCEDELCNLGEVRKNLENLLPQTLPPPPLSLMSSQTA